VVVVVAIDPSPVHTALVVVDEGGAVLGAATLPIGPALLDRLLSYFETSLKISALIERPPASPGIMSVESQQTVAVYWLLRWYLEWRHIDVSSINPGSWKPAARAWKIQYPALLEDNHQWDAYQMAMVHLKKRTAR
jgi:hypothetical protein